MIDPVRVLYVDDDPHSLEVRQELLEDHGAFTVHTETRPEDALERLDAGETFDCLLSDLEMPGMDGVEFLKEVRERDPDLPFILFTADESDAAIERAMDEGATDFIPKSIASISYRLVAKRIENAIELAGKTDTPVESDDEAIAFAESLQEAMDSVAGDDEAASLNEERTERAEPEHCPVPGCRFEAPDASSFQAHFAEERDGDGVQARLHAAFSPSTESGDTRDRRRKNRLGTHDRTRRAEGPVDPDDLMELDRKDLYQIARRRGIAGRSRLDQGGLYEAIIGTGQTDRNERRSGPSPASQGFGRNTDHGSLIDSGEVEGPGLSKAGLQAIGQTVRQILVSERWPREETSMEPPTPEVAQTGLTGAAQDQPITATDPKPSPSTSSRQDGRESTVSSGETLPGERSPRATSSDKGTDSGARESGNRFALSLGDPDRSHGAREAKLSKREKAAADESILKDDLVAVDAEPGKSSLISADTHEAHDDILCNHHLGGEASQPVNLLLIRYGAMETNRLEELASTAAELTVVAIGYDQKVPESVAERIELIEIDKPDDLRRLGIVLTRAIENWSDDPTEIRICIDSLNVLLRYADVQKVFRFLRLLFGKFESADAVTHAHLDPSNESDRDVSIIKSLFDQVIELDDGTLHVADN